MGAFTICPMVNAMMSAVVSAVVNTMMRGLFGVLFNGSRVAFHQGIALADNRFRFSMFCKIANLLEHFMKGVMTLSMIFSMSHAVMCAVMRARSISSESGRRSDQRRR